MGTRGIIGVVSNGAVKIAYNHYDSYPDGVGFDVLKAVKGWIENDRLGYVRALAFDLVPVDENDSPTAEQWEKLKHLARNLARIGVSTGEDWYSLLRNTQGDINAFLEAGVYCDAIDFAGDSLFCEWGYIVDLDNEVLEIYKGFQKDFSKVVGRFASAPTDNSSYAQISLVRSFSFDELPENFDDLERDIAVENGADPADYE